jgi:copper chaperone CopZ
VKQHLGRQSGVQSVDVSLIDGKVEIVPKDDGQIDPRQLLKAVYDSGVSVAEMDVTARGRIAKDVSGNLLLNVNANQSFAITQNEFSKELKSLVASPTTVTVRGQLYKKPEGKKKPKPDTSSALKLSVLEIQKKE